MACCSTSGRRSCSLALSSVSTTTLIRLRWRVEGGRWREISSKCWVYPPSTIHLPPSTINRFLFLVSLYILFVSVFHFLILSRVIWNSIRPKRRSKVIGRSECGLLLSTGNNLLPFQQYSCYEWAVRTCNLQQESYVASLLGLSSVPGDNLSPRRYPTQVLVYAFS